MSFLNKYCLQPKLNISTLLKINAVFKEQKWTLDNENMSSLYNRFCTRLSQLASEEQELIIDLTKRFVVIPQREYLKYFMEIIHNPSLFEDSIVKKSNKIYILPLISKEDIGKIKSSSFLWYCLKSTEVQYDSYFAEKKLCFHEGPDGLSSKINDNPHACLLLVDDYIGSGKTAESAVSYCAEFGINPQKIVIAAIAAQRAGVDALRIKGITVYTNTVLNRGISDWYTGDGLAEAICTMKSIEKKLKVAEEFKFGYEKSEALITLSRTPNNTFPVFWLEKGAYGVAPFPRN